MWTTVNNGYEMVWHNNNVGDVEKINNASWRNVKPAGIGTMA